MQFVRSPEIMLRPRRSAAAWEFATLMRLLQAYKVYRPDADGGVPEVISQLTALRECGDDIRILVARSRGLSRRYVADDTPVTAVGSLGELLSMPLAPTFPLELWRAARACDVLALHSPFPLNDLGLLLGVPDRVAVVVHWHAQVPEFGLATSLVTPFVRRTLERADRIIVSDKSLVAGELAPFDEKCVAIPYGIDVAYWSSLDDRQTSEAEQLRSKYPRLIVSTGRLVPYKGYPVLLQAMQDVDGELIIIGEGREYERLLAMARELGVADRVTFKGYLSRDDLKVHLHAAQLFALASISTAEAFGIVQIEAMASSLPVVNTDLPTAVPEIARDGIEGLTVTPGNPKALGAAIRRLLDDEETRTRMRHAALARAQDEYSQARFLERIRQVYSDALRARKGG